ncbi:ABC transporter permease [Paenibacillus flagellatus]|uniref:ABC transporter permease n=1 Tax=Paenibacillus flagellatus TaxID=2211139 RepID=A0A2V5KV77_9BACL|nr:ABC transporter permease [Paenibacillus flagellatus]PYI53376.1 ABC transporter permease [Paenibacillus flagellatus]
MDRDKSGRASGGIVIGQIALLLAGLGFIEYAVRQGIIGSLYLSEPTRVVREIVALFANGDIFPNLAVTLQEFLAGYLLAALAGIGTGLFLVLVPRAETFFGPFLSALLAVPKVTIIPLLMLWLGIGLSHKIAIVFLFCFFTIAYNTITGVKQTADNHLKVARVFEATKVQTVLKVVLPSAAPTIFAGLRVSAATGLVGALFGEMIASKNGLGNLLVKATSLYDTAKAFAIITVVTVVSVLLIAAIDWLEKKVVLRWKSS